MKFASCISETYCYPHSAHIFYIRSQCLNKVDGADKHGKHGPSLVKGNIDGWSKLSYFHYCT